MNKNVKRIGITITILVFLFLLSFPPFLMLLFETFPSLDKSPGSVLELILHPDTKYSSGYSDKKFTSIQIGMTEQQVLEILGEPLTRWLPYQSTKFQDKKHLVGLQYSTSPSSTHYKLRQIFLNNGKVAEIISYFYID